MTVTAMILDLLAKHRRRLVAALGVVAWPLLVWWLAGFTAAALALGAMAGVAGHWAWTWHREWLLDVAAATRRERR